MVTDIHKETLDIKNKSLIMEESCELLNNIDKIHTTLLGYERIKKNLGLKKTDPVRCCIDIIKDNNSNIYRKGKNWYCKNRKTVITINANSYTIITAHSVK